KRSHALFHMLHAAGWRSGFQARSKLGQHSLLADSVNLDTAVIEIPHIAAQAQPARLRFYEEPISDALHSAPHYVKPCLFRCFLHRKSEALLAGAGLL